MAFSDRLQLIAVVLVAMATATAFSSFHDFPGPHCAKRSDPCCHLRQDDCNVPLAGSLCYCDEFCNRTVNSDCCPDYYSFCHGAPEPVTSCNHKGRYFSQFDPPIQDNCNLCRCTSNGIVTCETDLCLIDDALIKNVEALSLQWNPRNYSEFWGRKYAEGLQLRTGTFEPTRHVKAMSRLTNKLSSLPQFFDARDTWPGMIGDPQDQGWCGSSWVLTTAAVSSDRFGIQSKGKEIVQLAPQQMLSCIRKQQGCQGGHLDIAWSYLRKTGAVDAECYPYIADKDWCRVNRRSNLESLGCELPTKVPRKDLYKMGPAYALNNETDIMSEIQSSGPVQATMRVYRDFFTYSGGIYKHSPAASRSDVRGFHSVKLIGWGEDRGIKYWIAANSWGSWWGENGYFRIERGHNECEIENYVLASWADVHTTKTKSRKHLHRM